MPISITTKEPKADVPFAKSPEFQKLQDAINQAKEALDDVSRQIVAIESKLNPSKRKPGEDAMAQAMAEPMAQAMAEPARQPGQPKPPPGPMEPHPGYPSSYDPSPQTPSADQPQMAYGDALGAPLPATNAPYRPNGRPSNFEEAIEDMRRIAGLR
jgi:hypothetical protein